MKSIILKMDIKFFKSLANFLFLSHVLAKKRNKKDPLVD